MTPSRHHSEVTIVGAGVSGLMAASVLTRQGHPVQVVDKGRGPGGRLATRRMPGRDGATARLDHGAQFFTVRSPAFAEVIEEWLHLGIVHVWCRGFSPAGDGYPRYSAPGGMVSIARHLAASLPVSCDVQIASIASNAGDLVLSAEQGTWISPAVVATPPVPQSLALCAAGGLMLPSDAQAALEAVRYVPCLALLVTLDRPDVLGAPGGLQLTTADDPTFSFIGDNQAKGASDVPAITFHVHDDVSAARYEDDAMTLRTFLLDEARRFLGEVQVLACEVKKWRYARPDVTHPTTCLTVHPTDQTTLVFAGDAFGEAKVEGAVLSGLAAAAAVLT